MTEPNIVTTAAPPPRRDRTLLDTALLPWPISRTGVKSRSDRVSARFLGRPLGGTGKVANRVCDR